MRKASAETTEKERNNVDENAGTLACYTKFRNILKVVLFIYMINQSYLQQLQLILNWQINLMKKQNEKDLTQKVCGGREIYVNQQTGEMIIIIVIIKTKKYKNYK